MLCSAVAAKHGGWWRHPHVPSLLHAKKPLCFYQVVPPHLYTRVNPDIQEQRQLPLLGCILLPCHTYLATNQSRKPESDFEMLVLEFRSYVMPSSWWIGGGRPRPVWPCCIGLSVTVAVSPLKPPNIRPSAVLIVFEWTKQIHFTCLHIAVELSPAYDLGLYWEFMVLLFLGRAYTAGKWTAIHIDSC